MINFQELVVAVNEEVFLELIVHILDRVIFVLYTFINCIIDVFSGSVKGLSYEPPFYSTVDYFCQGEENLQRPVVVRGEVSDRWWILNQFFSPLCLGQFEQFLTNLIGLLGVRFNFQLIPGSFVIFYWLNFYLKIFIILLYKNYIFFFYSICFVLFVVPFFSMLCNYFLSFSWGMRAVFTQSKVMLFIVVIFFMFYSDTEFYKVFVQSSNDLNVLSYVDYFYLQNLFLDVDYFFFSHLNFEFYLYDLQIDFGNLTGQINHQIRDKYDVCFNIFIDPYVRMGDEYEDVIPYGALKAYELFRSYDFTVFGEQALCHHYIRLIIEELDNIEYFASLIYDNYLQRPNEFFLNSKFLISFAFYFGFKIFFYLIWIVIETFCLFFFVPVTSMNWESVVYCYSGAQQNIELTYLMRGLDVIKNNSFLENCYPVGVYGFVYKYQVDNLSLLFILLTVYLVDLCLKYNYYSNVAYIKFYTFLLLLLEWFLIQVFLVNDLLWFYIFFEATLIPMFLIINIWGSRDRKKHASYLFFFYTIFGSSFILIGLLFIKSFFGVSTDFATLSYLFKQGFCPVIIIIFLSIFFFFGFSVKIPMYPVHIWLPEAHVEAPTAGSVILAGVLLKLGGYGFLRVSLYMFGGFVDWLSAIIIIMSLLGIIYCSFSTLRQIDLKKIIAYSSIVHMNFAVLGIFLIDYLGLAGAIFMMTSHGLISGAMFFSVGMLYDRFSTRNVFYYGGIVTVMPILSSLFFFFVISNVGFPGTSGFVGEYLISIGLAKENLILFLFCSIGIIFSAVYSFWLYTRVFFGPVRFNRLVVRGDLAVAEFEILYSLVFFIMLFGVFASVWTSIIEEIEIALMGIKGVLLMLDVYKKDFLVLSAI